MGRSDPRATVAQRVPNINAGCCLEQRNWGWHTVAGGHSGAVPFGVVKPKTFSLCALGPFAGMEKAPLLQ